MASASNHYALIMCGGSGPRLWPLSRSTHPKQFLQLIGNQSLIRQTYHRLSQCIPSKNIFFISHRKYRDELKQEFARQVPAANFFYEPEKKNTAMAILYAATKISQLNPSAIITSVPSDHFIDNQKEFATSLQLAATAATQNQVVVALGYHPSYPNPSFGYILPQKQEKGRYYQVNKFIEKPDIATARILIKKGALWNTGIYTYTASTIIGEIIKDSRYSRVNQALTQSITQAYSLAPSEAIDTVVSEKSTNLVMIKSKFIWSDIGEWQAIWRQLQPQKQGITPLTSSTQVISHDSTDCLVNASPHKLIALVAVHNLAIIDTDDGLLICNLKDSSSVREIVRKIVSTPKLKKYFLKPNEN